MANGHNKRGYLRPYKSYVFRDKDPVIDQIRTIVEDSRKTINQVAIESGVSSSTMYNWFHGKTRRPQFATVEAAGRACGRTLVWKKL